MTDFHCPQSVVRCPEMLASALASADIAVEVLSDMPKEVGHGTFWRCSIGETHVVMCIDEDAYYHNLYVMKIWSDAQANLVNQIGVALGQLAVIPIDPSRAAELAFIESKFPDDAGIRALIHAIRGAAQLFDDALHAMDFNAAIDLRQRVDHSRQELNRSAIELASERAQ